MRSFLRLVEYKVLIYRILLVYFFYFLSRFLFYVFNSKMVEVESVSEFFSICYHGLAFDTTAIIYTNSLFILMSVLPLWINITVKYQKALFYVYFISNLLFTSLNFVDFIYYKYNFARLTIGVWNIIKNEEALGGMFFRFLITYWYVFISYIMFAWLWIKLYQLFLVKNDVIKMSKWSYFLGSAFGFIIIGILCVGGVRGDFKKSTRPINLIDANRHVRLAPQADLVLNTPFTFLRTLGVKSFVKPTFNISEKVVEKNFKPIKLYKNNSPSSPNIVLIITESMGREYIGAFNKNKNIPGYKSYTPFVDSLATKSLIFPNAFGNGYNSIHGMSSVISGIPSFKEAFTSSPYAKQKIESLVSCLKSRGYTTSFFHGAPNGSMGFLGYANILGYDNYYGMTEYANDKDFDGSWGIWDEPFMQFMNQTLSKKKSPFFGTIFTVSSHEPYAVPKKYKGKFPKGTIPMHECIGYTDYAFKMFFESAKKQPWFKNTIFIITSDHCNLVGYPKEYSEKILNRMSVPIIIYKPDGSMTGINNDIAQQIDIYPTILDLIGYDKPFRSWGRSLVTKKKDIEPYLIHHNSGLYYLVRGNYVCQFDGKIAIGFYKREDEKMVNNLIKKRNKEMNELEVACKAFIQDYFNRIIDKKLSYK